MPFNECMFVIIGFCQFDAYLEIVGYKYVSAIVPYIHYTYVCNCICVCALHSIYFVCVRRVCKNESNALIHNTYIMYIYISAYIQFVEETKRHDSQ